MVFDRPCCYNIIWGSEFMTIAEIDINYSSGIVEWFRSSMVFPFNVHWSWHQRRRFQSLRWCLPGNLSVWELKWWTLWKKLTEEWIWWLWIKFTYEKHSMKKIGRVKLNIVCTFVWRSQPYVEYWYYTIYVYHYFVDKVLCWYDGYDELVLPSLTW